MKKLLLILVPAIAALSTANSQTWTNTGLSYPSIVYTIIDYNGSLQVGGAFSTPHEMRAQCVYNGNLYSAGTNFGASTNVYRNGVNIGAVGGNNQFIFAMAVYNNELYVAGSFTTVNGVPANNIARWNGTVWSAVGAGAGTPNSIIAALCVYNGALYAGGQGIGDLLKWNGTSWSVSGVFSQAGSPFGYVRSMAVYSNSLYVGGTFDGVNGLATLNLASYDGIFWQSVGDIGVAGGNNGVSAITTFNGEIYIGGNFGLAGGTSASNIARWNGGNWLPLSSGTSGVVLALHVFNQALYVGGNFTDAGGVTVSNIAKWAPPCTPPAAAITYQGPNTVCNPGGSKLLSANTGTGLTYQWKQGNSLIGGATSSTYLVGSAGGIFSVIVTNASGCSATSAQVVINTTTSFANASPAGPISLCTGGSVVLTAYVNAGYTYQWKRNGAAITGATLSTFTVTTAGNYTVDETYGLCTKTSNIVVVTVGGATASITGSATFCAGASNILTANTGAGISYQWYRNTVLQSGATSSTFNANSTGTYYVVETSTCGTAQSNSIVVSQINNPNPTVSYSTPLSFCSPGNVVLTSSTFSGVSYQWQKNSVDIAGATSQSYTATTNGTYRVRQTANGCFKYAPAVTVATATSVTAAITANGPVTFCSGGSVVLSVTNAIPGYSYQWKNNGANIANATQSSYTATTAGSYTCLVTASCGNATSNAIVVSTGGITALVSPSGSVNICTGATAALSANTGSGYNYQWKLNNVNIAGATSSTYNATTAGSYTVAITSPCGNATSAATTVNIAALTAAISPTNPSICAGSAQTFTANGGYNYSYQWFRNGIAQSGATNQTYANSSNGSYTVRITQGTACTVTSSISTLTVINNPTPTITPQGPTTFCNGQNVVLQANTFAGVSYQWQKNSVDIAAATNQNYTATAAGAYKVKQTANGCTKSSPAVTVTVNCREARLSGQDIVENELKVMPNPFSDELTIYGLEFKTGDKLQLINMLGKVIINETIAKASPSGRLVGLVSMPAGVYFLNVITSQEKKVVKVVKQ